LFCRSPRSSGSRLSSHKTVTRSAIVVSLARSPQCVDCELRNRRWRASVRRHRRSLERSPATLHFICRSWRKRRHAFCQATSTRTRNTSNRFTCSGFASQARSGRSEEGRQQVRPVDRPGPAPGHRPGGLRPAWQRCHRRRTGPHGDTRPVKGILAMTLQVLTERETPGRAMQSHSAWQVLSSKVERRGTTKDTNPTGRRMPQGVDQPSPTRKVRIATGARL